ncbi:hypothetical protein ACLOJK_024028, partial [Asimina triloba]
TAQIEGHGCCRWMLEMGFEWACVHGANGVGGNAWGLAGSSLQNRANGGWMLLDVGVDGGGPIVQLVVGLVSGRGLLSSGSCGVAGRIWAGDLVRGLVDVDIALLMGRSWPWIGWLEAAKSNGSGSRWGGACRCCTP